MSLLRFLAACLACTLSLGVSAQSASAAPNIVMIMTTAVAALRRNQVDHVVTVPDWVQLALRDSLNKGVDQIKVIKQHDECRSSVRRELRDVA